LRDRLGRLDVEDRAARRPRNDAVLLVERFLDGAPALRLAHRLTDRVGVLVRVHEHATAQVAGRTPDRLDQAALAAQEAFLVGIENSDERDLRDIETFAQEVDADENVELAAPQIAD